jgi:hypothetical protein
LLANGRWFSPGTPASSTTKTGHHDIAEILLKGIKHNKPTNHNKNTIEKLTLLFGLVPPVSAKVYLTQVPVC